MCVPEYSLDSGLLKLGLLLIFTPPQLCALTRLFYRPQPIKSTYFPRKNLQVEREKRVA